MSTRQLIGVSADLEKSMFKLKEVRLCIVDIGNVLV